MRKILIWLLAMCSVVTLAAAETVSFEEAGFAPIEKEKWTNKLYEQLSLEGIEATVLAYSGENGKTEFRIYGSIGKTKGVYPVLVTPVRNEEGETEKYEAALLSVEPVKENQKNVGKFTPADAPEVPEGFTVNKKGIFQFTNIFGEKESYIYGTFDGENFGFYKAENNRVVPGSLCYSLDNASERMKPDGRKKMPVPAEFKNGFQETAEIVLSDGERAFVPTIYPMLSASMDVAQYLAGEGKYDETKAPTTRKSDIPKPDTGSNPVVGDRPASAR